MIRFLKDILNHFFNSNTFQKGIVLAPFSRILFVVLFLMILSE